MKIKLFSSFFMIVLAVLSLSSCASFQQNGWLSAHRNTLNATAQNANLNAEQKLDILLTEYATLMEEGLKFTDPRKGVRYISKFQDQNDASLNQILGETTRWVGSMSAFEAINLATRLPKKPELKRFIDVGKQFRRKYQAYKNVLNMTSKVGGALGKFGGALIGF